jgi:hypothetical protein
MGCGIMNNTSRSFLISPAVCKHSNHNKHPNKKGFQWEEWQPLFTHTTKLCANTPLRGWANFLPPPTSKRGKQMTSGKQLQKLGSWANPQIKRHKHNNSHAESQPSSAYPKNKKTNARSPQQPTKEDRKNTTDILYVMPYLHRHSEHQTLTSQKLTTHPVSIIRQNLLNPRRHSKSHTRKMKTKTKPSRDNNLKTTATTTTTTTATRKLLFPGLASTRRY